LWDEARSIAKEPGQPVLFLQTGPGGATWEGCGRVVECEERWKAFGVYVRCTRLFDRSLPALPRRPRGPAGSARVPNSEVWDNPSLPDRIGLNGYRLRTPFLDEGRDVRVTSRDFRRLVELQGALAELAPT
jgi:hypothetical protein